MIKKINYYGIDKFSEHWYICSSNKEYTKKLLTRSVLTFVVAGMCINISNVKSHKRNRVYFNAPVDNGLDNRVYVCVYASYN